MVPELRIQHTQLVHFLKTVLKRQDSNTTSLTQTKSAYLGCWEERGGCTVCCGTNYLRSTPPRCQTVTPDDSFRSHVSVPDVRQDI